MNINNNKKYLLALHSSSESFGIGVLDLNDPTPEIKSSCFEIGRKLSNDLFKCVEQLLPSRYWSQINRLAVATGPGGFTGTRLTISMARIIAQQNHCSLDGVSSFALMAPRLSRELEADKKGNPFWIKNLLNRRGVIAGKYQVNHAPEAIKSNQTLELIAPYLLPKNMDVSPAINAKENVSEDILELLKISLLAHQSQIRSGWERILPIYPTSPVDKINEII